MIKLINFYLLFHLFLVSFKAIPDVARYFWTFILTLLELKKFFEYFGVFIDIIVHLNLNYTQCNNQGLTPSILYF